jgi:hypothetical protein
MFAWGYSQHKVGKYGLCVKSCCSCAQRGITLRDYGVDISQISCKVMSGYWGISFMSDSRTGLGWLRGGWILLLIVAAGAFFRLHALGESTLYPPDGGQQERFEVSGLDRLLKEKP